MQAEFAIRGREDQAVRQGDAPPREPMVAVDRDNTAWLKELVQQIGWIDVGRFGVEVSKTAFMLVQHSDDVPLMLAALPLIEIDAKTSKLRGEEYAMLDDRLRLKLGGKQRYGSQVGNSGDGWRVMPLEDPAHVDEWRHEFGMPPLVKYLEYFKRLNGGKDVPIDED